MNKIQKALNDLKKGKLIIVTDDVNRENEGDLVGLADFITPESINFMISKGKGLLCAPISLNIAKKMGLFVNQNGNFDGTNFTQSIDGTTSTTGISALERFQTIQELKSNSFVNFKSPGHLFPLIAKDGGLLERNGHTEAAIDLAKLVGASEVAAIVEIINFDGKMMRYTNLLEFSKKYGITMLSIKELQDYIGENFPNIWKVDNKLNNLKFSNPTTIPTKQGKIKIQQVKDYFSGQEATLYWKNDIEKVKNIRIHSQCLTSEIFGSLKCDCKNQLDFFIEKVNNEKNFLLIYTHDEGRGIGLFNKINAYSLQEKGLDTVEANHKLGFKSENRNFQISADILEYFNIKSFNLFTNNPQKISTLKDKGFKVARKEIWVANNKESQKYLRTKISKMNHMK